MQFRDLAGAALSVALVLGVTAEAVAGDKGADAVARGRYLVTIGGCNDCHTNGYLQNGGNVPEGDWLKGTAVGYQGPSPTPGPG